MLTYLMIVPVMIVFWIAYKYIPPWGYLVALVSFVLVTTTLYTRPAPVIPKYTYEIPGSAPTPEKRKEFNKIRPNFWKMEAEARGYNYTTENINRMMHGKAPIGSDGKSMELHHIVPLNSGGTNDISNIVVLDATYHEQNFCSLHPMECNP